MKPKMFCHLFADSSWTEGHTQEKLFLSKCGSPADFSSPYMDTFHKPTFLQTLHDGVVTLDSTIQGRALHYHSLKTNIPSLAWQRHILQGWWSGLHVGGTSDFPSDARDAPPMYSKHNVIKIRTGILTFTQYLIHQPLEGCGGTEQPEWQDCELEQVPRSPKGRQLPRLLGKRHLPVAFAKISGGQIFCFAKALSHVIST